VDGCGGGEAFQLIEEKMAHGLVAAVDPLHMTTLRGDPSATNVRAQPAAKTIKLCIGVLG
jgi:hypothetical protein